MSGRALDLRLEGGAEVFVRRYDEAENTPGLLGEIGFSNEPDRSYDSYHLLTGNRISRHATMPNATGERETINVSSISNSDGEQLSAVLGGLVDQLEADGVIQ